MTVKTYRQSYQVSKTGKELNLQQGLGNTEFKKGSGEKCKPRGSKSVNRCKPDPLKCKPYILYM